MVDDRSSKKRRPTCLDTRLETSDEAAVDVEFSVDTRIGDAHRSHVIRGSIDDDIVYLHHAFRYRNTRIHNVENQRIQRERTISNNAFLEVECSQPPHTTVSAEKKDVLNRTAVYT